MKLSRTLILAACSLAGLSTISATAQTASTPQVQKLAPGTPVDPSVTFDAMLTGFEKEFMSAAKAMPAEQYSFVPTQAIFSSSAHSKYDGVKTFAQEVTHVAQANYSYASAAGRLKVDIDVQALGKLTKKEECLAALAASFAFSHKAFQNITKDNAFESVSDKETRASLAGGLVAHGFDHYGQMVEYLRMNGIVPPASVR